MLEAEKLVSVLHEMQQLNYRIVTSGAKGGICTQLAYGYLARLNRTLHAVALILPESHAPEIMCLMRPVVEAAIRVRWMSDDLSKAQLLIDDSALQTTLMAEQWLEHGFTILEHVANVRAAGAEVLTRRGIANRRALGQLGLVSTEAMEQAIWGNGKTPYYDLFFRSASVEVHASAESASRALFAQSQEDHRRALQFTLAASSLLIEAALPLMNAEESIVHQAVELSRVLGINWQPFDSAS